MSISVTKTPVIYVNGHPSKWLPVHQPITFEVTRMDSNVLQKYLVAGTEIHFKMSWFPPNTLAIGQKITYVKNGLSYVLTIKNIVLNGYYIIVDNVYGVLGSSLGFINFTDAYRGYFIETLVSVINSANQYVNIGSIKTKVNTIGKSTPSIQEILSTKTINKNDFLYNALNKKQLGEGGKFNIQVRESYNGTYGPYSKLDPVNCMFYTNSAKQIQEVYGYNMGEYVPTYDNSRTNKAKFQSVFKRPTYFVGYPFSLNFIYSDNMLNYNVMRKEETKGINGATIANTSDNLIISERLNANRLMIKQSYPSTVKTLDVWLESDGVATTDNPSYGNPLGGYGIDVFTIFAQRQTFAIPER